MINICCGMPGRNASGPDLRSGTSGLGLLHVKKPWDSDCLVPERWRLTERAALSLLPARSAASGSPCESPQSSARSPPSPPPPSHPSSPPLPPPPCLTITTWVLLLMPPCLCTVHFATLPDFQYLMNCVNLMYNQKLLEQRRRKMFFFWRIESNM